MSPESGQTLSHYRLIEKIGEGGMGVVWQAEDTVLGRTVAIKVLPADVSRDEERRRMFLEEARLASSVSQAHIVQVYEFGREGDLDFIVMEYVTGKPLSQVMQGRPLPPEKVATWGAQVAQALSRAHRKGLLHRDLKPANVLITEDGDAKVVDFGLATLLRRDDEAAEPASDLETRTSLETAGTDGKVAGTLAYMSPEQLRGEALTPHSDIFSLGVVLYEMTTGQRPFAGATPTDTAQQILRGRPTPAHEIVPKVPLDLNRIVEKTIAPRPGERYQTMEDLAVDLRRLGRDLETGSSPAYEDLLQGVARTASVRQRWFLPAAVGVGLVLILLLVWAVFRGFSTAPAADDRTVLVTPLEVRGQTDGADYVGRAFAEAMAVNLAQATELRVLPIPSPEESEGTGTAAEARRQGAGLLLGGALTRSADTIHASVSLVDTTQNRILWGAQQDAPEGDLARLAAALAREGLEELGLGGERVVYDRPQDLTGGPAMAASAELAETIGALRRYQLVEARDASRRLVEAFPEELDAQILRAATLSQMYFSAPVDRTWEELDHQLTILKRRAPDSPYTALFEATISRDMASGIASLTALLQRDDLTPAFRVLALRTRAWTKRNAGDPASAVADLEEARKLDPADAETLSALGYVLREAGRPEEAVRRARQAVALEPSLWFFRHSLGHALTGLGRDDEAAGAYLEACRISGLQQPCAAAAGALLRADREEEAVAMARQAAAMEDSMAGVYNLACFHALRGDRDQAMAFLQRGMEELGWFSTWLADDPDLESLHGDPEFEAILEELRRRQE